MTTVAQGAAGTRKVSSTWNMEVRCPMKQTRSKGVHPTWLWREKHRVWSPPGF